MIKLIALRFIQNTYLELRYENFWNQNIRFECQFFNQIVEKRAHYVNKGITDN